MIAELAGGEEITWLKRVAEGDFENECRECALTEIIRIDRKNQIGWLRDLVMNDRWSSVRTKALEAIVALSFDDCRNWLVDIVNGDDDYDLRRKALELLIDGEADDSSLLTWLQDLLEKETHYVLGNYIIDKLVEIGGKDQLPYLRQLAEETRDAHICIHACDHVLQNDSGDHIAISCLRKVLQNKIGYSSKEQALRKLQSLGIDPYEEWIAAIIEGKEIEIR